MTYPNRVACVSRGVDSGSLAEVIFCHLSSISSSAAYSRNCGAAHLQTSKSFWIQL